MRGFAASRRDAHGEPTGNLRQAPARRSQDHPLHQHRRDVHHDRRRHTRRRLRQEQGEDVRRFEQPRVFAAGVDFKGVGASTPGPSRSSPRGVLLPSVHPRAAREDGGPRHPRAAPNAAGGAVPDDQVVGPGFVRAVHREGASTARAKVGSQRDRAVDHHRSPVASHRGAHAPGQAPRRASRGPEGGQDAGHSRDVRMLIPGADHRGGHGVQGPVCVAHGQEAPSGRRSQAARGGHAQRSHRPRPRVRGVGARAPGRRQQGGMGVLPP